MNTREKTILITGAAKRVGAVIAFEFAKSDYNVALHYNSSVEEAESLLKQISKVGRGQKRLFRENLDSESSVKSLLKNVLSEFKSVDVVVNNAAVFQKSRISDISAEELHNTMNINCYIPLFIIKNYALADQSGVVINIIDQRVLKNHAGSAAYTLSKKMLYELTKLAAVEFATSIRVNGVSPGPVLVPDCADLTTAREKSGAFLTSSRPTPQDVAEAVFYLANAKSITGQIINVDGGQNLL